MRRPRTAGRPAVRSSLGLIAFAVLGACGHPLDPPPADLNAFLSVDRFNGADQGGFAYMMLETASCLQLPDSTEFRFQGAPPMWAELGGRDNNPLSAYIASGCYPPNANWEATVAQAQPPFVFEVESEGIVLAAELDDNGIVTRCDFPRCTGNAFVEGR